MHLSFQTIWSSARSLLGGVWSATEFAEPDVTRYAGRLILPDTRNGLRTMILLLLVVQAGGWILQSRLGHGTEYSYTLGILAALSLQLLLTTRVIDDMKALHLSGVAFLVLSASALALVAHQFRAFNEVLTASAALLIVAIPLVPWGVREATASVTLIYLLFTCSTLSVAGRFDEQTLWTLQFAFLATSAIALALVARSVRVRKHEIETNFRLEQERKRQELLSLKDPMTGAWNRRFLDANFQRIAGEAVARELPLELALLDVDDFKLVNDNRGHVCGDRLLQQLVRILDRELPAACILVRLGGDEFGILSVGGGIEAAVHSALKMFADDPETRRLMGGGAARVSAGVAQADGSAGISQDGLYRRADERLYAVKRQRSGGELLQRQAGQGAGPGP